uniref:KH domain-containing, RNA-binding, signal transduction-associated protein 2-like isoform X2 n=1 Tax=Saccoglossus kowalevskii TaxID=10224 RepID=A0ABM0LXR2_SACKO|nr:PREDICTED: KH domain-containing, RNA-binding, signal transduction-associated protein 2-like isoform X2 [Saccoglossus kowalevskii]
MVKIKKVQDTEGDEIIKSPKGFKFIDLTHDKPIRVSERVIVPVKDHPKFNFIGKILGPRGNSLKRMQTETGTKISILGKGSMRDKKREDDLRAGGEAKFSHLSEELHILVEAYSLPPDAHTRVGHALRELRKYLIPDNNDDIRQDQLRELAVINGTLDAPPSGRGGRGGPMRGRGGPGGSGRGGSGFRGGMSSGPRGPAPAGGRGGFGSSARGGSMFGSPGAGRPSKPDSFGFEEPYEQSYDQFFDSSSSYMDNSGASGGDDGYYDSSYPSGGGGNDFGQSYGGDQSWSSGGARFKSPPIKPGPRTHPYSRF